MSPTIQGLTQQLQDAIRAARPGLVRVYVLVAEYADGTHSSELLPAEVSADVTPEDDGEERAGGEAAPTSDLPLRRPDETTASYVQRLRRERGRIELRARQWAQLTGLPIGELERAMAYPSRTAPALPWRPKPDGWDNGAKLVGIDAIKAYLSCIEAVESGNAAAPPWWHHVRAGARRAA